MDDVQDENPVTSKAQTGVEANLDQTLRPSKWDEYVGQESVKENLRVLITAAKERNHAPEHTLLYGPPGLGKTTLAHLIVLLLKRLATSLQSLPILKMATFFSLMKYTDSTSLSRKCSTPQWRVASSIS